MIFTLSITVENNNCDDRVVSDGLYIIIASDDGGEDYYQNPSEVLWNRRPGRLIYPQGRRFSLIRGTPILILVRLMSILCLIKTMVWGRRYSQHQQNTIFSLTGLQDSSPRG